MPLHTPKLQDIYIFNQSGEPQANVRHLTDGKGTGEMECFQVAPGIQISYDSSVTFEDTKSTQWHIGNEVSVC